MQAVLIATGETKKLWPLTETIPSPMLPLVNRPIMSYVVELLARQKIKDILVSLWHMGASVESYFRGGQRWGVRMDYVLQREPWGSAGSLKWAERLLEENFLVLPADSVIDVDLNAALQEHIDKKAVATIIVGAVNPYSSNLIDMDANGKILALDDEMASENTRSSLGVYIFNRQVLDLIPDRNLFDINEQLLPALLSRDLPVYGYQSKGYFNPINSLEEYYEAQEAFLKGSVFSTIDVPENSEASYSMLESRQTAEGIWIGKNNIIHPSVRFEPPVLIGANCFIGRDVALGPDVVVGSNTFIDDEATIQKSTILENTYIGQLVNIENRLVYKNLLIDYFSGAHVWIRDAFLLGNTFREVSEAGLKRIIDVSLAFLCLLISLPVALPVGLHRFFTEGQVFQRKKIVGTPLAKSFQGERIQIDLFYFKTRNADGRYLRLGSWLERFDFHRLPQLINVILGDMSMVGVKPLAVEEEARLSRIWREAREDCPPGFTGLWYVQGLLEGRLDDILVADAYYTATRSWQEDLKLLLKTPSAWFRLVLNYRLRRMIGIGEHGQ